MFIYNGTCFTIMNNQKMAVVMLFSTTIALAYSVTLSSAFGQMDSSTENTTQSTSLPPGGLYMLQFIKSGGLVPSDETYIYNLLTHELTHVSANDTTKKLLNETEIDQINNEFYNNNLFRVDVLDMDTCPDCIQYGLSYGLVDFETRQKFSDMNMWNDGTVTEGVVQLNNFTNAIEKISSPNNTEPCSCPPGVKCIRC